jgi:hypothetical protein
MWDSKTLRFWLVIFAIGFASVFLAALLQHFAGVEVPLLGDFLNLLGLGGGGATARNIVTDGVMPRWQAAQAARPPLEMRLPPQMTGGET